MNGKWSVSLVMGKVPSKVLKGEISGRLKPSLRLHEACLCGHMTSQALAVYLEVDHFLPGVTSTIKAPFQVPPSNLLLILWDTLDHRVSRIDFQIKVFKAKQKLLSLVEFALKCSETKAAPARDV